MFFLCWNIINSILVYFVSIYVEFEFFFTIFIIAFVVNHLCVAVELLQTRYLISWVFFPNRMLSFDWIQVEIVNVFSWIDAIQFYLQSKNHSHRMFFVLISLSFPFDFPISTTVSIRTACMHLNLSDTIDSNKKRHRKIRKT